jgi:ABC-type amino acid transport substrate-binding protein
MGWTNFIHEDEYDWGAMMGRLVAFPWDDPRTCHMAVCGVGILSFRIGDGMQFSRPEYRSGFGIMVAATPPVTDMWVFIGVFEWSLWLVLGVASFVIAAIIFFAERQWSERTGIKSKYSGSKTAAAFEAVHRSLGKVCNAVNDLNVVTVSAKLVSLFWSLTVIILIATYTAALTARQQATSSAGATSITSRADLPGKTIISYYEFIPLLKQYGFIPEGFPWFGDPDAFAQMQKVAIGEADAFILDEGLLQVGIQGRCDLKVISDSFQYRDYGHVFHKLFPYEVILE